MTDQRSLFAKCIVAGAAIMVLLGGACSPAPVETRGAKNESAVSAFNRHEPTSPPPAASVPPALPPAQEVPAPTGVIASHGSTASASTAVDVNSPPTANRTQAMPAAPISTSTAATPMRIGALPDSPGRATVQRVCSSCHALGMVTAKGRTDEGWSEVIGQMINNGMEASDDDLQTVHAYLTREFPPK